MATLSDMKHRERKRLAVMKNIKLAGDAGLPLLGMIDPYLYGRSLYELALEIMEFSIQHPVEFWAPIVIGAIGIFGFIALGRKGN